MKNYEGPIDYFDDYLERFERIIRVLFSDVMEPNASRNQDDISTTIKLSFEHEKFKGYEISFALYFDEEITTLEIDDNDDFSLEIINKKSD